MILHGSDFQSWFALIVGALGLILGIVLIARRAQIGDFMAGVQSTFGGLGRRVARENMPWVYIMVGTIFAVLGILAILGGLFLNFEPPGTPL